MNVLRKLDKIATQLEAAGHIELASELDKISVSLTQTEEKLIHKCVTDMFHALNLKFKHSPLKFQAGGFKALDTEWTERLGRLVEEVNKANLVHGTQKESAVDMEKMLKLAPEKMSEMLKDMSPGDLKFLSKRIQDLLKTEQEKAKQELPKQPGQHHP